MSDAAVYVALVMGLPLLGFIYYLEHKKRMYLLERYGLREEPNEIVGEKKLIKGLFLSLSGLSLTFVPNIASIMNIEATLTLEMLLIGAIVTCAGLAILISGSILREKSPSSPSQSSFELDEN
ncbi:MAG: hypothetical protein JW999_10425 [Methanotrichaceae archaeon]|nr:hypothetical protein [Methanotrichaceae archaeon]